MTWYRRIGDTIVLTLYVQPGAKQNCVMGLHGEALKIRLSAPSVDGRANKALIKYLATLFGVPMRQIVIKQGEKSRSKVVAITGSLMDPQDFLIK